MAKSKKVNLTMVGASGRMGTQILGLADKDPRFNIMAGVENPKSGFVGRFTSSGRAPIVGDINEVLHKTDVVIDFSHADSVMKNAEKIAKKKRGLVIGTTGLKKAALKKLKRLSKKIPIVFSPNMSLGVNLLFKLVEEASRILAHYDIEIVEAHHSLKKDAPSGTAMKLAQVAAAASKRAEKDFVYGRRGMVGARKKKEIGVMSLRAGDIVGDHTVLLSNPGERVELIHRAHSRDAFASGALDAAAWVKGRRAGLYSMHNVLGL